MCNFKLNKYETLISAVSVAAGCVAAKNREMDSIKYNYWEFSSLMTWGIKLL